MNKLIVFLLTIAISTQAFAATCDIPTQIGKGDSSPCTGYVISPETEVKIRTELVYKESLIKNLTTTNDLQASLIKNQNEQIGLYQSELHKSQTLSTVEKVLYFGLGAVITGAIAYGTVTALRQ